MTPESPRPMVLRAARIRAGAEPVDLLIGHHRILAIGADIGAPHHAAEVDLGGRHIVPGLWDNHTHFSQWALTQQRPDLSGATSAREAAAIAGAAVPDGAARQLGSDGRPLPVVGNGFRDALWPDAPTLAALDEAGRGEAIVLISADLHAAWLNTAALERYGFAGHPTGLLREDDAFEVTRLINTVPETVLDGWVDAAARAAAARGVVGIVDLEMAWNLDGWNRRIARGTDSLRVEFGIYPQHLARAIELGMHTGERVGPLLTVGPLKIITDGSLNTRTAYCYDEYPGLEGCPASHGILTVPPHRLRATMRRGGRAGIMPAVHAIGDHANTLVLDAFERLGLAGRLEHAQLLAPADVARFAALGVAASVQPEHAMDDRDVADRLWAGRTDRAFMLRSLLDAGAQLLLGSDAPVAALDPWVTIAAAVGRSRDGRAPWHPEQAITTQQAIAASVRTSIAAGERADIAILDSDPWTATADELREMPVAATLLSGRFTHRAF